MYIAVSRSCLHCAENFSHNTELWQQLYKNIHNQRR